MLKTLSDAKTKNDRLGNFPQKSILATVYILLHTLKHIYSESHD